MLFVGNRGVGRTLTGTLHGTFSSFLVENIKGCSVVAVHANPKTPNNVGKNAPAAQPPAAELFSSSKGKATKSEKKRADEASDVFTRD